MYVCICRGITSNQISEAVCNGAHCIRDLNKYIGIPVQCGKCCHYMKEVIQDALNAFNQVPIQSEP
jgi:bacterioferritin-associated ferredoxin